MKKISWEEYDKLVSELANKILNFFPGCSYKKISLMGVPRGGEMLALLLSYKDTRFQLISYNQNIKMEDNVVLIDDVLETGKTLDTNIKSFNIVSPTIAVLIDKSSAYNKDKSLYADISIIQTNDKDWFVFPYENIEIEIEKEECNKHGEINEK